MYRSTLGFIHLVLLASVDAFCPQQKVRTPSYALSAKNSRGAGFGKKAQAEPQKKKQQNSAVVTDTTSAPFQSVEQGGSDAIPTMDMSPSMQLDPNLPAEERTKILLRDKYGLKTLEEMNVEQKQKEKMSAQRKKLEEWKKLADQGEDFDFIAMIPPPIAIAIDRFLKAGVAITTVLFVLAGLGITVEAWSVTSGTALPENIDNFIVNVIEPNFTTGLLVLLGFSVSLGAFAAAQLGSNASQYREDN